MNATVARIHPADDPRCSVCTCRLGSDPRDDLDREICGDCKKRPEAARLGEPSAPGGGARSFTAAERSLIRKLQGYMPAQQLLDLLNERLAADLGPDAAPYTMSQLHETIGAVTEVEANDWAGLRKLLSQARRSGLLDEITPQMMDDFAVVFSISPAQALRMKDTITNAQEGSQ